MKIQIPMEHIILLMQVIPNRSFNSDIWNIYIKNWDIYGTDSFLLVKYKNVVDSKAEFILPRNVLGGFKKTYLKKENIVELENKEKWEILLTIKSGDIEVIKILYKHPETQLIDTIWNFVEKFTIPEHTSITYLAPGDISPLFANIINQEQLNCDIVKVDNKSFFYWDKKEITVIKRIW